MIIAVGSDEKTNLTDFVVSELEKKGLDIQLFGPLAGENLEWTDVAEQVANSVAEKSSDQGIIFCCTGTGVTIAANKVPGIRAALCCDSGTAEGARKWNDANILTMSLRATSESIAKEILEAWFSAEADPSEKQNIEKIYRIEQKHSS